VSHTYRYTVRCACPYVCAARSPGQRDTKGQHQLRVTFFALKGLGWIDDAPESVMMVEPHGTWDVSDKHVFQVHELVLPA